MFGRRLAVVICAAVICSFAQVASAEERLLFLRGKVKMQDGSPMPRSSGLEKICSDRQGSGPGPITDKDGNYLWRMAVDPMRSRQCFIKATMRGYTSSEFNVSNLNGYTSTYFDVPDLVLFPEIEKENPRTVTTSEDDVPRKSKDGWRKAMQGVRDGDLTVTVAGLQEALAAEPKFARGWHTLGIVYELMVMRDEARPAYQKAADLDAKMMEPRLVLAEFSIKDKQWQQAADLSQAVIKLDKKRIYPDAYLHLAVAQFHLGDMAAATTAAEAALNPKEDTTSPRAGYVLGRILAAKGDFEGARARIEHYLQVDPETADADQIRQSLETLQNPYGTQPELEVL